LVYTLPITKGVPETYVESSIKSTYSIFVFVTYFVEPVAINDIPMVTPLVVANLDLWYIKSGNINLTILLFVASIYKNSPYRLEIALFV
jgi:hypothetical protein